MDMLPAFFYNLFLTVAVIVFAPLLFVKVILTPKYRKRAGKRLGFALGQSPVGAGGADRPRIWVHALSVGEVASARNLVYELRRNYPLGIILFSSATKAGESFARSVLDEQVDCFLPFPFDLLWSVKRLISWARPDLFVLVETDFWPNFLGELNRRDIPCLLVNGRISESSLVRYRRFRWFFRPLFNSFQALAMQTEQDAASLRQLGVDPARLVVLGNLKYDAALSESKGKDHDRAALQIPAQALVWVAGSTHRGEEEIIFAAFQNLAQTLTNLFLVVAPRNVERGGELAAMAGRFGLLAFRRSLGSAGEGSVLILDTLGELASVYALCDVAFVGGSLVPQRGHNPLEPAVHGKPVLFGPFMEDFAEISRDLLAVGGARQVRNAEELRDGLSLLLAEPAERELAGRQGQGLIAARRGVAEAHLALIRRVLAREKRG